MRWEIEIRPRDAESDLEAARAQAAFGDVGVRSELQVERTGRLYLIEGDLDQHATERLAKELLTDTTVEASAVADCGIPRRNESPLPKGVPVSVLLKPGVMDPVAESVLQAGNDLALQIRSVRTGRRYYVTSQWPAEKVHDLVQRVLANDAIERVVMSTLPQNAWGTSGTAYVFRLVTVPLRNRSDSELIQISRDGQLSLSLAEMQTIREHFRQLDRDPSDVELETIAQTWSEHCSHKTLKGKIDFTRADGEVIRYDNLLKQTIFHATQQIRQRLGKDDWCVSVFEDNAGIIRFDDRFHACFKVETHNHPSAIEPYGGANTGLGGVIRDVLGTGLGGRPICNTDVFCFAPPDYPAEKLPNGVLHPKRVMRGVVAGVRDYGNRMGIPTVNGAICFDNRYLANPLVYCGTVGLIPAGKERKEPRSGDLIVAVGGRTGRDGIHGATFSSAELTHQSEELSGGAVQIGNAITEKKLLDVILAARDRNLFHAITDCGAGGFSSAVGEMGADIGAEVHFDRAPLKYEGLSYTEIWISEAQERMVLAVPPDKWPALRSLCEGEDVEATVLGEYKPTGRLQLFYQDQKVGDLDMHFLHDGRPPVVRKAKWTVAAVPRRTAEPHRSTRCDEDLLQILSSLNVASKEWVIRQYDHEVQGGSVVKPLVGQQNDGPGDAAVIAPVLGSTRGLAIGCGINPHYGDLDPYWMAASAIDEAVRNVVAVGADPSRIALLDNFCWGNTNQPETLGSLVRAAEACRDVALAYGTPFISGKDSLNNEFHSGDLHITIPPTLLISAIGIVPDVRKCATMDLKKPGNMLFLVGATREEMGGSQFHLIRGLTGGKVPEVDCQTAPRVFRAIHDAICRGLIVSCHDVSEGGLATALAEMCIAGSLGADVGLGHPWEGFELLRPGFEQFGLFSETNSRFIIEVVPTTDSSLDAGALRKEADTIWGDLPRLWLGQVIAEPRLKVYQMETATTLIDLPIAEMKEAWQRPLRW